jgi:Spy/CpxP family protein refolding chaperone
MHRSHRASRVIALSGALMLALLLPVISRAAATGPPSDVGRHGPDGGPRFGGPPPMFHLPPPEVLESLKLSDAQRTKIDDLRDDAVRSTARTEADLQIAELDLRKVVESDHPDRAAVEDAIERVAALRTTLFKARVSSWIAFRGVLTPAQRTQLRSLGPPQRPPR